MKPPSCRQRYCKPFNYIEHSYTACMPDVGPGQPATLVSRVVLRSALKGSSYQCWSKVMVNGVRPFRFQASLFSPTTEDMRPDPTLRGKDGAGMGARSFITRLWLAIKLLAPPDGKQNGAWLGRLLLVKGALAYLTGEDGLVEQLARLGIVVVTQLYLLIEVQPEVAVHQPRR